MAGREDNESQTLKIDKIVQRLRERKKRLNEIINNKRIPPTNPERDEVAQPNKFPEELEISEDPRAMVGWLNLSGFKKRRRYLKKKCWIADPTSES